MADTTQVQTSQAVTPPAGTQATGAAAEVAKVETATAQAVTDESKSKSKDFAILARKERQLREQTASLKAEKEKLAAEAKKYEEWRATGKTNPIKALDALGVTFEDVQNYVLNGGKVTPELKSKMLEEELASVKKQQTDFQKAQEEREAAAAKAASEADVRAYFDEAKKFVTSNPEKYELTNSLSAFNMIEQAIQAYAEKTLEETGTPEVLSFEQAADAVEKHLEEQVEKQYKLVSATKKFQQKWNPPQSDTKQSGNVSAAKTINNSMTASSVGKTSTVTNKKMSDAERIAALAAKFNTKK